MMSDEHKEKLIELNIDIQNLNRQACLISGDLNELQISLDRCQKEMTVLQADIIEELDKGEPETGISEDIS